MARFVKGDVVVVPFPFSDLTQAKRRPALVISVLEGDDLILCQITSQTIKDKYTVPIDDDDFVQGSLKQPSNVRPNRIFTADSLIVLYRAGNLKPDKVNGIIEKVIEIIHR
ncbi:MAG: type II toxin-antitoxin system PemK/MazF family toxin [Acidobacteriota bacterium]